MDYAVAPKEKSNTQTERIIEIEAIVDGQTVLTNTNKYAASAVAKGTNKELSDIKAMLKQLADYVTAQATTVETLSIVMNGVSSGAGKTIEKKKARPSLHVCAHCNQKVYHKDGNCLDWEANRAKRYPGWKSVFTKE